MSTLRRNAVFALAILGPCVGGLSLASTNQPGCENISARACVALSITAMGGKQALQAIHTIQLDTLDNTALAEQSYRQQPFLQAYDRTQISIDFDKSRVRYDQKAWWPEADPGAANAEVNGTVIATADAAIQRVGGTDYPGSLSSIDDARSTLALGPERLLLTALAAVDLHFEASALLRSTPHSVVAFRWRGYPVRVLINEHDHLPDAVESTRPFNDFWFVWGDVTQRVYYDNWKLMGAMVYPTDRFEERNGIAFSNTQVLEATFNTPLDDARFKMDADAAAKSAASKGWNRSFDPSHAVPLAPDITLYGGSWNASIIKQDDGVIVLEAPISATFSAGIFSKARQDYPGATIKAVLTTSDSWPHVAGVREAVAEGIPVYALDLNRPLLDRLIAAPHSQAPDALQRSPKTPQWQTVEGKFTLGSGATRMELYPLRGAATERQYMVYFPQYKLLYASDTLVYDAQKKQIYDPELTYEVVQAVAREHLQIDVVYAMHQAPMAWKDVLAGLATFRPKITDR